MTFDSPICVADTFHFSHYYYRHGNTLSRSSSSSEEDEKGAFGMQYRPKQEVKAEDIKLKFYAQVMGDGSNNIHFGKWDGIPVESADAYGKASEAMTDYMFDLALRLLPHRSDAAKAAKGNFSYVDLGAGTGASAMHIADRYPGVARASCLNVCHAQNQEGEKLAAARGLADRVQIVEGNYEDSPFGDRTFDLAFSQDAFVHAISKAHAYNEAFRITKPGGAFVFCDLTAGEGEGHMSSEERHSFADHNSLNDFLTPSENVRALEEAGWRDVTVLDLTADLRISFQLMLKKVNAILEERGGLSFSLDSALLKNYYDKITDRLAQIDHGAFKWMVFHCRKPILLDMACAPPVPFENTSKLISVLDEENSAVADTTSVVVVDILKKMPREKIEALPKTVELLVTLSAGLDHIDMAACAANGIAVRQSGRDAITAHVVEYVLAFMIVGLRQALDQLGNPFPKSGWNLKWNIPGKPLHNCKIAIVGMGIIAKELVRNIRAVAPDTTILYHVPAVFREAEAEQMYKLTYCEDLCDMASQCDVLLPLCPLTKHTEHMINAKVLSSLSPEAGFINMARGKVVDTDALTEALEKKAIKYAILDTTYPEPLPEEHPLWSMENCFILPHFATNTVAVREALVEEIQPIVEEYYGFSGYLEKARRAEEERTLRHDLAVAHRLTAERNWDMLTWNHISARFEDGCLITNGRQLWSQVRPQDLVFSSANVTADLIHSAIYAARPDVKAIIHLHSPAATSVSCLQGGFVPITQDGAYFYKKVANYEWDGVSNEAGEGPLITAAVREVPGCNTLLMHNHGFVCFGASVKEAWVLAYYFERCCEVQLRTMQACGGDLSRVKMPPTKIMEEAAKTSYLPEFAPGMCEWEALCKDVKFD